MTGADRPVLGVMLMLGFCVVAPLADSVAKLLGHRIPLIHLLVARFGLQVVLLLPLVALFRIPALWPWPVMRLVILRTGLHILGIGAMFAALRHLPLADAVAIAFVMPFILLFLGRFFFGEEVGARRFAAAVAGFAGTLCVVQPSFAEVGAPALLPLVVAVVFALFMLVTRRIARATDPIALQMTSGIVATVVLVPAGLLFGEALSGRVALSPGPRDLWLLLALGVLGTGGHLLMTWSLRFAPASTLAPMQYLEIPVAAIFGWLIFRDFPNGLALVGIAITVAAGLYVIARERAVSRASAPPVPPAAPPAA